MNEQIETHIRIDAPIEAVWAVLTDFQAYPTWSPTIAEFFGTPKVGQRTKVLLTQPGGTSITMNPIFLQIDANRELRWKGRLLLNGIFDGEHYFQLESLSNGQTELIQGEKFSGLLVPFMKKMIHGNTKLGFEAFNRAIKERVESSL